MLDSATPPTERIESGRLGEALRLIDGWVGPRGPSGVGVAVWLRGALVAERYAGEARPDQPVTAETIFAACFGDQAGHGSRGDDAGRGRVFWSGRTRRLPRSRVSRRRPRRLKAPIPTLERLRSTRDHPSVLAHTSGLPEDLGPRQSRYAERVDLAAIVDAMCRLPAPVSAGQRATLLQRRLRSLDSVGRTRDRRRVLDSRPRPRARPALPPRHGRPPRPPNSNSPGPSGGHRHIGTEIETYNSAYWRSLAIPWGGLFGTPRDLVRFAGVVPGGRSLAPLGSRGSPDDQPIRPAVPGDVAQAPACAGRPRAGVSAGRSRGRSGTTGRAI